MHRFSSCSCSLSSCSKSSGATMHTQSRKRCKGCSCWRSLRSSLQRIHRERGTTKMQRKFRTIITATLAALLTLTLTACATTHGASRATRRAKAAVIACDVAHLACMACSVAPIVGVHVTGVGGEIETIACDLARPACAHCAAKQAAAEASASTTGATAQ